MRSIHSTEKANEIISERAGRTDQFLDIYWCDVQDRFLVERNRNWSRPFVIPGVPMHCMPRLVVTIVDVFVQVLLVTFSVIHNERHTERFLIHISIFYSISIINSYSMSLQILLIPTIRRIQLGRDVMHPPTHFLYFYQHSWSVCAFASFHINSLTSPKIRLIDSERVRE